MRTVFLLFTTFTLAACGKLLAADEDADPPVSTDGGASDAAGDGGAADDAPGSADGAFLPDGGCAARFCCNFDGPDAACAWGPPYKPGAEGFTAFGPSNAQANSQPNSLRVLTDDVTDGPEQALVYTLPALVATSIHFKVRLDLNAGESSIHPLEIHCESTTLAVKLRHDDGEVQAGGNAVANDKDLPIAMTYAKAQWFGIDVAVTVPSPDKAQFTVTSDLPNSVPQQSDAVDCPTPELRFGGIVNSKGPYDMYLDDIVVE